MTNHVYRLISEPIRNNPTFEQKWRESDEGLVACWEIGRIKSYSDSKLSSLALNGELPVLGWKGGVDKAILKTEKYGTLNYLAQWYGLRGENLDIDKTQEYVLTCT